MWLLNRCRNAMADEELLNAKVISPAAPSASSAGALAGGAAAVSPKGRAPKPKAAEVREKDRVAVNNSV